LVVSTVHSSFGLDEHACVPSGAFAYVDSSIRSRPCRSPSWTPTIATYEPLPARRNQTAGRSRLSPLVRAAPGSAARSSAVTVRSSRAVASPQGSVGSRSGGAGDVEPPPGSGVTDADGPGGPCAGLGSGDSLAAGRSDGAGVMAGQTGGAPPTV